MVGTTTTTTLPEATTTTTEGPQAVRETGTLQGQGSGKPPLLRFVDDSSVSTIKVGDAVQTAGGADGLAPEGLPIGTISNISLSSGRATASSRSTRTPTWISSTSSAWCCTPRA